MSHKILIKNGRVVDPVNNLDAVKHVMVEDGKIVSVTSDAFPADTVLDVRGMVVLPGLIDMHVHLREPGDEDSETIATGLRAALAGGFTAVAAMPNTNPTTDTPDGVEFVLKRAREARAARLYPVAAITRGRKSEELADLALLARAGAVAFSDDGSPVHKEDLMRKAMERAKILKRAILAHCEVVGESAGGIFNSDAARRLGLPGISADSEFLMVRRDIELARETGCALHVQHVSTAESLSLIARAKDAGVCVTAEATPHHLALSDDAVTAPDPNLKMNPPLRSAADMAALRDGVCDGIIDAIATDHAPHSPAQKSKPIADAPFGIIGMETALPIILEEFLHTGKLNWSDIVRLMSLNPARILHVPGGALSEGAVADITVIDPMEEWTIEPEAFESKGRNCPFAGRRVRGRAKLVMVNGEVLWNQTGK
jgi:dihydroorotase